MSLILKNTTETNKINKNNYFNYINNLAWKIRKELKNEKLETNNDIDVIAFTFYIITPAFEEYIVEKFKKKWIDLYKDPIQPDENSIFPKWTKSWIKYFNEFLSELKDWKIKIQDNFWNRDVKAWIKAFFNLDNKIQAQLFKIVYYGMYNFSALSRVLRTTVIENTKKDLEQLKK